MKVRAGITKISSDDQIVWRRSRGRGKAKLYVINKLKPRHKQRQG